MEGSTDLLTTKGMGELLSKRQYVRLLQDFAYTYYKFYKGNVLDLLKPRHDKCLNLCNVLEL